MKLTNEVEMSKWAYYQCLNDNDTPEIRNLMNNDFILLGYCLFIKDREDVRKRIKSSILKDIKNLSELPDPKLRLMFTLFFKLGYKDI